MRISNKFESIEYFELEQNINDFENSAVRNNNQVFFFYNVPDHPFYDTSSSIKVGTGYAECVPIKSVETALNELIQYVNSFI